MVQKTLQDYIDLKANTILALENSEKREKILACLLRIYNSEIDSTRIVGNIKTSAKLIQILEKRDVLSCRNVTALRIIVELLNNQPIFSKITDYEDNIHIGKCPTEPSYYDAIQQSESIASSTSYTGSFSEASFERGSSVSNETFTGSSFSNEIYNAPNRTGTITPRKKERIYYIICDEIGSSWRDLSRNLSLRESVIDEMNMMYPFEMNPKIIKILKTHEKNHPYEWPRTLCQALRKSRRMDLNDKVEKILYGSE